jgi:WD40 repeat protein
MRIERQGVLKAPRRSFVLNPLLPSSYPQSAICNLQSAIPGGAMRVIESKYQRPLNLLALGAKGFVAAASSTFGAAGDIEVWDATTGTRRSVHREPNSHLGSLVFHPNGHTLVFSRQEGVYVLEAGTGESPHRVFECAYFAQVAVSPDGARLLLTEERDPHDRITCLVLDERFAPTGLWSTGAGQRYSEPVFGPGGERGAVAVRDESGTHPRQEVQVRAARTGAVQRAIPLDPASPVRQLAFTADGAGLLVRTDSNKVVIHDAATGAPAGELAHRGRPYVTGIAVHPAGPVACARTDGTVTFWDVVKREATRTLDWKLGRLVSVAFNPDGALAAAGTEDGKIVVWDVDL